MFNRMKDRRRQIFRYWDGSKMRRADPAIIQQRMLECPDCNFDTEVKLMNQEDKFGQEAYDNVLKGIRYAFNVKDVDDDGGLTTMEQLTLLSTFYSYCHRLKKSFSLRPTLSQTPASAQSNGSTTKPSSASPSLVAG